MTALSDQQQALLDEVESSDDNGVYIENGTMRQRTAEALFTKGLVGRGLGIPGTTFYGRISHPDEPIPDPPEGWVPPTD